MTQQKKKGARRCARLYLHEFDALFAAVFDGPVVPHGDLHFADVQFVEEQHTQAGLSDAAAHREGEFALGERAVEGQAQPLEAVLLFELFDEGDLVHADAHGGEFQRAPQRGIPHHDVAV